MWSFPAFKSLREYHASENTSTSKNITRITEHKRAVSHSDPYSKIDKHAEHYDHRFDFDNATIVYKTKNIRERLFLEAWYSLKDLNAGNDHREIPAVFKTLLS